MWQADRSQPGGAHSTVSTARTSLLYLNPKKNPPPPPPPPHASFSGTGHATPLLAPLQIADISGVLPPAPDRSTSAFRFSRASATSLCPSLRAMRSAVCKCERQEVGERQPSRLRACPSRWDPRLPSRESLSLFAFVIQQQTKKKNRLTACELLFDSLGVALFAVLQQAGHVRLHWVCGQA
jgi:hypothetical protein